MNQERDNSAGVMFKGHTVAPNVIDAIWQGMIAFVLATVCFVLGAAFVVSLLG
ncbi:MAG: hypothetical protein V4690_02140 [Patescibacteria group bacterium]